MGTNLNSTLGSFEEMAEAAESTVVKTAETTQAETVPAVEAVTEVKTEETSVVADNMETPKAE
jgi:hypothetical protein